MAAARTVAAKRSAAGARAAAIGIDARIAARARAAAHDEQHEHQQEQQHEDGKASYAASGRADGGSVLELLEAEGMSRDSLGQLVQVEHAQVLEPTFWRTDKDAELGVEAFIQPGDLVALDEVWRFWSGFAAKGDDNSKRPERVACCSLAMASGVHMCSSPKRR